MISVACLYLAIFISSAVGFAAGTELEQAFPTDRVEVVATMDETAVSN